MANIFKTHPGLVATIGIVVLAVAFVVVRDLNIRHQMEAPQQLIDTAFIDTSPNKIALNDSMPYYLHKHLEDSLQKILNEQISNNTLQEGPAITISTLASAEELFRVRSSKGSSIKTALYFVTLPYYTLPDSYSVEFHDEKFWLRQPADARSYYYPTPTIIKEVKVNYRPASKELLLPIEERTYSWLRVVLLLMVGIVFAAWIYVIVGVPITLLLNISRRKVFCAGNIRILKQAFYIFMGYSIVIVMTPLLLRFFLSPSIPPAFRLSFSDIMAACWRPLLGAAISFVAWKAFQKGYVLEKEQELTI